MARLWLQLRADRSRGGARTRLAVAAGAAGRTAVRAAPAFGCGSAVDGLPLVAGPAHDALPNPLANRSCAPPTRGSTIYRAIRSPGLVPVIGVAGPIVAAAPVAGGAAASRPSSPARWRWPASSGLRACRCFPSCMPSSLDPGSSLTHVGRVVQPTDVDGDARSRCASSLPLVLGYTIWCYVNMWGRVTASRSTRSRIRPIEENMTCGISPGFSASTARGRHRRSINVMWYRVPGRVWIAQLASARTQIMPLRAPGMPSRRVRATNQMTDAAMRLLKSTQAQAGGALAACRSAAGVARGPLRLAFAWLVVGRARQAIFGGAASAAHEPALAAAGGSRGAARCCSPMPPSARRFAARARARGARCLAKLLGRMRRRSGPAAARAAARAANSSRG